MGDPSNEGANEAILDRKYAQLASKEAAALARTCLRALLARGTHLLVDILTTRPPSQEEHDAICGFLRQGLVMADGLDELLMAGASNACVPILRSLFEVWIQATYLVEPGEKEERTRRALCWLVASEAARLEAYARFDPASPEGQAYAGRLSDDLHAPRITFPSIEALDKAKHGISQWLAQPHVAPIHSEYLRTKGRNPIPPPWFKLYGGPGSLRGLAAKVGLTATFDELYGEWSEVGHGRDPRQLYDIQEGGAVIRHLREPREVPSVASSGIAYLSGLVQLGSQHVSREELVSFGKFYVEQVQAPLHRLWALRS